MPESTKTRTIKLWRVVYTHTQGHQQQVFTSAKSKCGRIRKDLRRIHGSKCITNTESIQFPVKQADIIDWLNRYCKHHT